jgi:glycosyltransferase involved in cell wall biosynthesis
MISVDTVARKNHNYVSDKMSLVSVIIPTYNHAQFLPDAIESVFQQVYGNVEILVIDDGSTDETRAVIEKYGSRIRYVWQQNQGLSAARNTGLRLAEGEFIALLDADDMYEPKFLSTLVDILQTFPELDGVHCAAQTVDVSNKPLPQRIGKAVKPEAFQATLLDGGYFPPLCMVACRYCYEQLDQLFDESLTASEDWDMWLRFSQRYSILGIEEPLVRYRVVPGSMSRDPERMIRNRTAVLQKYFAEKKSPGPGKSVDYRRALGKSHLRGVIEHLQAGNERQAYNHFRDAFLNCPQIGTDVETFYLVGQGAQPMGYRGEFSTLDLESNIALLFGMLDRLFADKQVAEKLEGLARSTYGNAFLAMGLLSYGAQRFRLARRLLLHAAAKCPGVAFERQFVTVFLKTLLGVRTVAWFKELKQSYKSDGLRAGSAQR